VQDHVNPGLLFAATEFGVFFSVNDGDAWTKLAGGVPNIAFRDLAIQTRENDLVGATFGRSFYVLDDYSPLREVTTDMLETGSVLFPVRRAHWYIPKRPHSCTSVGCVDSQGDAYFVSPNPPFGAVFTYYLAEERKNLKDQRTDREKDLAEANENVTFPDWDRLDEEALEDDPAIVFTVTDTDGNVIRHIEAPAGRGFQRVNWDLRYPDVSPWVPEEERDPSSSAVGVLVAPGTYQVSMHERIDGVLTDLDQIQTFAVVSIREPTLPGSTQQQRIAFQRQVDEMQRAVDGTLNSIEEVLVQLGAIEEVLQNSTANMSLYSQANSLEKKIIGQRDRLSGNQTRGEFAVNRPVTVTSRLGHAAYNPHANAHGPTATQRESLTIAQDVYGEVSGELTRLVDREFKALLSALDAAGVPWTPGRGILTPN
jgi:hypothetical protein